MSKLEYLKGIIILSVVYKCMQYNWAAINFHDEKWWEPQN